MGAYVIYCCYAACLCLFGVLRQAEESMRMATSRKSPAADMNISRKVSLFDLNAKYASVIPIAEARDYLNKLDSKS